LKACGKVRAGIGPTVGAARSWVCGVCVGLGCVDSGRYVIHAVLGLVAGCEDVSWRAGWSVKNGGPIA